MGSPLRASWERHSLLRFDLCPCVSLCVSLLVQPSVPMLQARTMLHKLFSPAWQQHSMPNKKEACSSSGLAGESSLWIASDLGMYTTY